MRVSKRFLILIVLALLFICILAELNLNVASGGLDNAGSIVINGIELSADSFFVQ